MHLHCLMHLVGLMPTDGGGRKGPDYIREVHPGCDLSKDAPQIREDDLLKKLDLTESPPGSARAFIHISVDGAECRSLSAIDGKCRKT